MTLYLDSSALVKLVQRDAETRALRRFLRSRRGARTVTSALARVEVVRAVLPGGPAAVAHARRQLALIHQVPMDRQVLNSAALLNSPVPLRSLDAVHLASADLLGAELDAVVTYDQRMASAAEALGMTTEAPA